MRRLGLFSVAAPLALVSACAALIDFPDVPNVVDAAVHPRDASVDAVKDAAPDAEKDATLDADRDVGADAPHDAAPCDAGLVCEGVCTDVASDLANCGACGATCGGTCTGGRCLVTMIPSLSADMAIGGLLTDETSLYWCDFALGVISKVPLDGGAPVTLYASHNGSPTALTLGPDRVYWIASVGASVNAVAKDGGAPITLATNQPVSTSPQGIAVSGSTVFWTNMGVTSVDAGGGPDAAGTVRSVAIDGGSVTTVASGQLDPGPIVASGRQIYWVDRPSTGGSLLTAAFDGGSSAQLAGALDEPMDLAASTTQVFVTDVDAVLSVSVDGGAPSSVAGSASAEGDDSNLAVDDASVYWSTYVSTSGNNQITKARLGGGPSTAVVSLPGLGISGFHSIVVGGASLYFTDGNNIYKLTPK